MFKKISYTLFVSALLLNTYSLKATEKKIVNHHPPTFSISSKIGFTENLGQFTDGNNCQINNIFFKAELNNSNVWITQKGLVFQFFKFKKDKINIPTFEGDSFDFDDENLSLEWERIDLELKNAVIKKVNIVKENPIENIKKYYSPNFPNGLESKYDYQKIIIKQIYRGIDWIININDEELKYEFKIYPNAKVDDIQIAYYSKNKADTDIEKNFIIPAFNFSYVEKEPISFYKNETLKTSFKILSQKKILMYNDWGYETVLSFKIEKPISKITDTLIIDPLITWATFYGGNAQENATGIVADSAGNIFLAGHTYSLNFPTYNNGNYFQGTIAPNSLGKARDVFVSKFNNNGLLLWSTYYGGSENDVAYDIAIDAQQNILICGATYSGNFPTQAANGFFQNFFYFNTYDAFILKFDNNGNRLYCSYFGGNGSDYAKSIVCDGLGNYFISGHTTSNIFPLVDYGGYFQSSNQGQYEIFISKFDLNNNLVWSTFLGGSLNDYGNHLAIDTNNNVYLTGTSNSSDFPLQNAGGYFQNANSGDFDIIVSEFSNNGVLLWSTYYGGSLNDIGHCIEVDKYQNIYISATSSSHNIPTQSFSAASFFQNNLNAFSDLFLIKFNAQKNLIYASYFGGNGLENNSLFLSGLSNSIVINNDCNQIYITFHTSSTNLPIVNSFTPNGYIDSTLSGGFDQFLIILNHQLELLYSGYIGGNGVDKNSIIGIDKFKNIFMAGSWQEVTNNSSYPINCFFLNNYCDQTFNGDIYDIGIIKFNFIPQEIQEEFGVATLNSHCQQCNGQIEIISNSNNTFTYTWSNGDSAQTAANLCQGIYSVIISDSLSCFSKQISNIVIGAIDSSIHVSVSANTPLCTNDTLILQAGCNMLNANYLWYNNNILYNGSTLEIQQPPTNLSGYFYVWAIDSMSNCSNFDSIYVQINPIPVYNLTVNSPICYNGTLLIHSNAQNFHQLSWSGPNNYYSNDTAVVIHQLDSTNSGVYYIVISNNFGCMVNDSVEIYVNPLPVINLINYNHIDNCAYPYTTLHAYSPGNNIVWNGNGLINALNPVTVSNAGTYYVTVTSPVTLCSFTDSVIINNIISLPEIVIDSIKQISCFGANDGYIAINVQNGVAPYYFYWNNGYNGNNANSLNNLGQGLHWVSVEDSKGCMDTMTFYFEQPQKLDANFEITDATCKNSTNGSIYISGITGGVPPYNLFFENNVLSWPYIINNLSPGNYNFLISDSNQCLTNKFFNVSYNSNYQFNYVINQNYNSIYQGDTILVEIITSNADNITWFPNTGINCDTCFSVYAFPNEDIVYYITLSDTFGCIIKDSVLFKVDIKCPLPFFPTIFSPNNDGLNDLQCVLSTDCIESIDWNVYNRWGEKIFESNHINDCWDGTFNGKPVNTGVYVYNLRVRLKNGKTIYQNGNLTVVR